MSPPDCITCWSFAVTNTKKTLCFSACVCFCCPYIVFGSSRIKNRVWPYSSCSNDIYLQLYIYVLCLLYSLASGVEGIDILIADVGDQDSLERMCAEADVVIDCVGPVSLFNIEFKRLIT